MFVCQMCARATLVVGSGDANAAVEYVDRIADPPTPGGLKGGPCHPASSGYDMSHARRKALNIAANCYHHLLIDQPEHPFCEYCNRAKAKDNRRCRGLFNKTATT